MDEELFRELLPASDEYAMDIHSAASIGCEKRILEILDNSAGRDVVEDRNKDGWTPLMYAAYNGRLNVVLLLLRVNAEPDVENNQGQTALILASKCGNVDIVNLLIEYGACMFKADLKGWTAISYAVAFGHRSLMQLLIKRGAYLNVPVEQGKTPLMLAASAGYEKILEDLLILDPALANKKDVKGWTALSYAIASGRRRIMQLLLGKGADIKIVDDNGMTPLMIAAASGHERIVQDLLQLGLNVDIESKSGDTAKSLARKNGHINVTRIIDSFVQPEREIIDPNLQDSDLFNLLKELQLTKYYILFESHDIDLNTFWQLTDDDLKQIGIKLLGPRKKICMAISQHQQEQSQSFFEKTANPDNICMENKKLNLVTGKLKSTVLEEKNSKITTEQNFAGGLRNIQNYNEMVKSTLGQAIDSLQKLRENQDYLRNLLCDTFQGIQFGNDRHLKMKIDCIFQSLDIQQKLAEVQKQNMFSLQQSSSLK